MGNIGITIVNTVILLVFLACAGNLIVGGLLNAIRESKGKPKKKRTSLIIFDIAMMAVCLGVFSIMQRNEPAESSEPEAEQSWSALYSVINPNGSIVSNLVVGTYPSLDACKAALSGYVYGGAGTIQKSGCANNCALENGGVIVYDVSTCTDFERL